MIPALPNPPLNPSLVDVPEGELVSRLLADPHWRASILCLKGMPEAPRLLQRVALPAGFAGDADILAVRPEWPSDTTAIEVKRIKVGPSAFETGVPNKLHEYEKGVQQANLLSEIGFGQIYLFVVVVVDSRHRNAGRYTYDGLTSDLRAVIETRVSSRDLAEDVGLVVHEFVQPMDYPPLELGTYGGGLKRLARRRTQPRSVTDWVLEQLAGPTP